MGRKIFLIAAILLSIQTVFSQDSIQVMLEFKMVHVVDSTQPTNPRVSPCMLLAAPGRSIFDDYYRSLRYLGYSGIAVDRIYNDPYDIQDKVAGISVDQIYINFEKDELTTGSYFLTSLYAKKEPLPKIEWLILPQKKKILDQDCQMATATFKGRHYTAWFAPSIPISTGPWKLNGLPGIILAANDDKNEVSFTCTKITMPEKNAPTIAFSEKAIFISAEKFDKTKKAYDKDPKAAAALANPSGTLSAVAVTVPMSYATDPSVQKKIKLRPLNNPIEKE